VEGAGPVDDTGPEEAVDRIVIVDRRSPLLDQDIGNARRRKLLHHRRPHRLAVVEIAGDDGRLRNRGGIGENRSELFEAQLIRPSALEMEAVNDKTRGTRA
jgi:hypothetical protein